jgi:hypothetical protein
MDDVMYGRIVAAVEDWAASHPNRQASVLRLGQMGKCSPDDVVEAIRSRTAKGEKLLKLIEQGIERQSLDVVLASFDLSKKRDVQHDAARSGG